MIDSTNDIRVKRGFLLVFTVMDYLILNEMEVVSPDICTDRH